MIEKKGELKVSVIDVGSNSTKMLVATFDSGGTLTPVTEQSFPCRLLTAESQKLRLILPGQIEQISDILRRLISISLKHESEHLILLATEAFRRAGNRVQVAKLIEKEFGHKLYILSGQQEAELIAEGVYSDPLIRTESHLRIFDLGGGSLEIIESINGRTTFAKSLPLGALALAESINFQPVNAVSTDVKEALRETIFSTITETGLSTTGTAKLIGLGGTIYFMRKILAQRRGQGFDQCVHFSLDEISALAEEFCTMSSVERGSAFPALPPDRADIFPLVCLVIEQLMIISGNDFFHHSFFNLRYGVASKVGKTKGSNVFPPE